MKSWNVLFGILLIACSCDQDSVAPQKTSLSLNDREDNAIEIWRQVAIRYPATGEVVPVDEASALEIQIVGEELLFSFEDGNCSGTISEAGINLGEGYFQSPYWIIAERTDETMHIYPRMGAMYYYDYVLEKVQDECESRCELIPLAGFCEAAIPRYFYNKSSGRCEEYGKERDVLLKQHGKKNLILYAPTFSPSLTSTVAAKKSIFDLADTEDIYLLIKFHDLMDKEVAEEYKREAAKRTNVHIVEERNILKVMIMADLMISDTSSVVYEYILLNKPVITINSFSKNINWCNIQTPEELRGALSNELGVDAYRKKRMETIQEYHPYTDGKSSARMIAAVEAYIREHGVPERRKLNLYRRYKIRKLFGADPT